MPHKFCFYALLSYCVVFTLPIFAAGQKSVIRIIPEPKQVEATNENFHLKAGARMRLADTRSKADRFAAQDFISDAQQTANVTLKIGGSGSRDILIGLLAD